MSNAFLVFGLDFLTECVFQNSVYLCISILQPCFRDDGRKHKIFYFADVCAGPGGFTEYILWRKKWQFKGFGFTLKDCGNDFTVNRSPCVSDATFQPLFGSEKFNNGDIFIPENITSFRDDILKDTDGKGVHFMMADGVSFPVIPITINQFLKKLQKSIKLLCSRVFPLLARRICKKYYRSSYTHASVTWPQKFYDRLGILCRNSLMFLHSSVRG